MTQKISPAVFSSAARMAPAMRALSTSEIMTSPAPRGAVALSRPSVRPRRKLPDAPAPPNEPPPPEKPPGQEEPDHEPDDPHEPGIGMKIGPREPRRGPAPLCAYPPPCLATLRTIMKKMRKKNRSARTSRRPGSSSVRCLESAFHSSE